MRQLVTCHDQSRIIYLQQYHAIWLALYHCLWGMLWRGRPCNRCALFLSVFRSFVKCIARIPRATDRAATDTHPAFNPPSLRFRYEDAHVWKDAEIKRLSTCGWGREGRGREARRVVCARAQVRRKGCHLWSDPILPRTQIFLTRVYWKHNGHQTAKYKYKYSACLEHHYT